MKKKKNVCGATGMLESLAQQRSEEPVTPKTPCQTLKESIKVENKTGKKKTLSTKKSLSMRSNLTPPWSAVSKIWSYSSLS